MNLVSGVNINGSNPKLKGTLNRTKLNGEFLFNVVEINDNRGQHNNSINYTILHSNGSYSIVLTTLQVTFSKVWRTSHVVILLRFGDLTSHNHTCPNFILLDFG